MTGQDRQGSPGASADSRAGWMHFAIAAGVLLVATAGWTAAIKGLNLVFAKLPVPPPEAVKTEDHRLLEFPKRLGPYVLAEGEYADAPKGWLQVKEDELGTLGMGGHAFNWYYMALYRDGRSGAGHHVRLDITYYTGLLDPVPHVPDVCIVAGGGSVLPQESGPLEVSFPSLEPPWDHIRVFRTAYEVNRRDVGSTKSAQYYFFSVNGRPAHDRLAVRGALADLRLKYCYFAKIQTATHEPVANMAASDAVCQDFLRYALPEVLRYLPSAAEVERLNTARSRGGS
jgi:hypothetical protein